ncbi:MAG: hypothetical protein G8237_00545 [Magnetococcales bacterium]|nr:hypothetical protein [Magnetococcales bacterium]NGZ04828.1 hypothetical protein [Magnetococcales bacterium]
MSNEHPFHSTFQYLFRPVNEAEISGWKVIHFDKREKKIFTPGLFSGDPWKKEHLLHYQIRFPTGFSYTATRTGMENPVQDPASGLQLGLMLRYQAYVIEGQEEKFLRQLESPSTPGQEVDRLLRRWLKETLSGNEKDFLENFSVRRDQIAQRCASLAREQAGLEMQIWLIYPHDSQLQKRETYNISKIPVKIRDFHEEQFFSLSASSDWIPEKIDLARIESCRSSLSNEDLLKAALQDYLLKSYSPQEFFTKVRNGELSRETQDHLNTVLNRRRGRNLLDFRLRLIEERPVKEFYDSLEHKVSVELIEFPKPVEVINQAQAHLVDYARYRLAGAPDLRSWFNEKIDYAVKQELYKKTYEDVLTGFSTIATDIKKKMSEWSEKIGYKIDPLVTKTETGPEKLLEGFRFELDDVECKTASPQVTARLGVLITGKLIDLSTVKPLLKQEIEGSGVIVRNIANLTRETIDGFMRDIDPQQYYMSFDVIDHKTKQSIKSKLVEEIIAKLTEKFKATDLDVKVRQEESEVTRKLTDLLKSHGSFQAEVFPLEGSYPVPICGDFSVNGVDEEGWYRFKECNFDMNKIGKDIETHLMTILSTMTEAQIMDGIIMRERFENSMTMKIRNHICQLYGVSVNIFNVRKLQTVVEKDDADIEGKKRMAMKAVREMKISMALEIEKKKSNELLGSYDRQLAAQENIRLIAQERLNQEYQEREFTIEELQKTIYVQNQDELNFSPAAIMHSFDSLVNQLDSEIRKSPRVASNPEERTTFPWEQFESSNQTPKHRQKISNAAPRPELMDNHDPNVVDGVKEPDV